MEKNTWKNNRGITLIALIITILILTILTVVSMGVILSQDYFNKASDTVGKASSKVEQQKEQEENLKDTWDDIPGRVVKSKTNVTTTIELTARVENITRTSFRIIVEGTNKDNEDLTFSLKIADRTYTYEEKVGKEVYWDVGISPDTPLEANTTYSFEIIGRDSKSENNVIGEVSTLANNAPDIENVTVNPLTQTTATINVTATDAENDTLVYVLEISGDEKTSVNGVFELTGLTENTTYSYKVKVIDTFNAYDEYQNTFATMVANKAPKITINNVKSINTTSFNITAQATDENGDKLIYELYVSTSQNGSYSKKATSAVVAQNQSVTLQATGLSEYTPYWYYVKAIEAETTEKYYDQSAPVRVHTKCPGPGSTSYTLNLCPNQVTSTDCPFCVLTGRRGKTCPGYWTDPEPSSHCLWCGYGGITNYSCSVCDGTTAGYSACGCGSYTDIPISDSHTFVCYRCTDGKVKNPYTSYEKCSAHNRDDKHYYCVYDGCNYVTTSAGYHEHTETMCAHYQTGQHGEL